jgi:ribosome-binding protein aMBF1 (putative translation factor)
MRRKPRVRALSPAGDSVEQAAADKAARSRAYREEQARLAPYESIARVVIRRRMDLDLTQQEVAERMGTSHSAISRIESGQHPTKQETLTRLAAALEMDYVQGFRFEEAGKPVTELVSA